MRNKTDNKIFCDKCGWHDSEFGCMFIVKVEPSRYSYGGKVYAGESGCNDKKLPAL